LIFYYNLTIYLGNDPGSKNFGWSVCEITESKREIVDSGSWVLKQPELGKRMLFLKDELSNFIEKYNVEAITYELPVLRGANTHSVYFCTAVLELLSGIYSLPIHKVSASEMKKYVTGTGSGKGKEGKMAVEKSVREFFNTPTDFIFKTDHQSDACGVTVAVWEKLSS
jgi:Holliday junction resolvasome RuvABC endonuclease subunit